MTNWLLFAVGLAALPFIYGFIIGAVRAIRRRVK